MAIKAFIKEKNHNAISSIWVGDKERKYIRPTPKGGKNFSTQAIYVTPCQDHSSPHPAVPVELRGFSPGLDGGKVLGIARACPFCWTILVPVEKAP